MIFPTSEAAPGFDHPLEMLHACHGKIIRQCDTLQKLRMHIADHGCDEAARQAARGILLYFDSAGEFHYQDEELDLFPTLRASAGTDMAQIDKLLERLLADHAKMKLAWNELRAILLKLADGTNMPLPENLVARFNDNHQSHIALEESELLPLAEKLLDDDHLLRLGSSMSAKRKS